MPPSSSSSALHIHLRPQFYYLVQLDPEKPFPQPVLDELAKPISDGKNFLSVTRTKEEVSIVSDYELKDIEGGQRQEGKPVWRCFQLKGPMDLGLVGVLCDITTPLKAAGIPIFAISTVNTDWLLVPSDQAMKAVNVFHDDGWVVEA